MFKLVFEVEGNEITLEEGTYADICKKTVKFADGEKLKTKYKEKLMDFLHRDGQIVISDPSGNKLKKEYPLLYRPDEQLFKTIIRIPKKGDIGYKKVINYWLKFWIFIRYPKEFSIYDIHNTMSDIQIRQLKDKNYEIIKYNREFKRLSNEFILYLSNWHKDSWYLSDNHLKTVIFPSFKRELKKGGNEGEYYQIMHIVNSAFKTYCKLLKLKGYDFECIFNEYCNDNLQITLSKKPEKETYSTVILNESTSVNDPEFYDDCSLSNSEYAHTVVYYNFMSIASKYGCEEAMRMIGEYTVWSSLLPQEREEVKQLCKKAMY